VNKHKRIGTEDEKITGHRLLLAGCLAALGMSLLTGCNNHIAEPHPVADTEHAREVLVAAPGLVEPSSEEVKVGSEVSGRIQAVLVEEGAVVQRGQVIAIIENGEYQARLASAQAEMGQKKAELQRLLSGARSEERDIAQSQFEEAQAVLRNAQTELQRREQLYKDGDISREEFERADRDHRVATARHEQARQNHALVNAAAHVDDVAKAEAAVTTASGQMEETRALLNKTVVRSPMAGIVLRRHLKTGESAVLSSAVPIVTLGDTSGIRVRVDVDEVDVGRIQVGQRAFVSAPAYGEQKFEGRVVRISQMLGKKNIRTEEPTERIDTKILETLIELDESPDLPAGLRVNAFIVVSGS
jgi:HlyD family secretion protein